jgi:TctA family transporter
MEALGHLVDGFAIALTVQNIGLALIGCVVGTVIGALPGLGPSNGVAILIPLAFTLGLGPTPALILLTSVYYGAMYGGRISSILLNIPGDEPALMTTLDGYPMTLKGQAGEALALSGLASFVGAFFATWGLVFIAPQLVRLALLFGPAEYFALYTLAFATLGGIASANQAKAAIAAAIGLGIAMIGVDGQTGVPRLTFGDIHLYDGIDFLVAIVGLFAISEVFLFLEHKGERNAAGMATPLGRITAPAAMIRQSVGTMTRGTVIGFLAGVLPGAGASLGSFAAYTVEKRLKDSDGTFGTGDPRGVAAPEAGNNAAAGGALVPMLALGVPGSGTTAVLLAMLLALNITPGTAAIYPAPRRGLGADRGAVHRQHRPAAAQHPAGRNVRAGPAGPAAVPDADSGDAVLRRHLRHLRLHLRPRRHGDLRRAWLLPPQARRAVGAGHPRRAARQRHGDEPPPRAHHFRRRLVDPGGQPDGHGHLDTRRRRVCGAAAHRPLPATGAPSSIRSRRGRSRLRSAGAGGGRETRVEHSPGTNARLRCRHLARRQRMGLARAHS